MIDLEYNLIEILKCNLNNMKYWDFLLILSKHNPLEIRKNILERVKKDSWQKKKKKKKKHKVLINYSKIHNNFLRDTQEILRKEYK